MKHICITWPEWVNHQHQHQTAIGIFLLSLWYFVYQSNCNSESHELQTCFLLVIFQLTTTVAGLHMRKCFGFSFPYDNYMLLLLGCVTNRLLHDTSHLNRFNPSSVYYAMRSGDSHVLTDWGRVTHMCVSKVCIIGSDNGLSPGRRQAITWTNAGLVSIGYLIINICEILI